MANRNILVLGGTGFIGSATLRALAGAPHAVVRALARSAGSAARVRALGAVALVDSARLPSAAEGYFLVDNQPVTYDDIANRVAAALQKPLRTRSIPGWMLGLFAGSIVRSYMETDSKYSNSKLRSTGFELEDPRIEEGMRRLFDTAAGRGGTYP